MSRETLKFLEECHAHIATGWILLQPFWCSSADVSHVYSHLQKGLFGIEQVCPNIATAYWNGDVELF